MFLAILQILLYIDAKVAFKSLCYFFFFFFLQHDTHINYIKVPFTGLPTYIVLHYLQYS